MKDAIAAVRPDGESLRVVLEGVGRRLRALVVNAQTLALLDQDKAGTGPGACDGSGSDIARDAQIAGVSLVPIALSSVIVT